MDIKLHRIPIRFVVEGYEDSAEEGVVAYDGRLDVRPRYQREFIYKDRQRDAVIETINKGFPLNVMYWMVRDDGGYEILDGQQRTISIGQYVNGDFSLGNRFFHNLTDVEKDKILSYELMVYFCEGTDRERLDWFTTINIVGMKLTDQEIRNAVYAGSWLSDAKLEFSKPNCVAFLLANAGGKLVSGSPIRQEYLETAIKWISNGNVDGYMAIHQHDDDADELWTHFDNVISWVRRTFTNYRHEMANVDWGELYNRFKSGEFDTDELEVRIKTLMEDEDVTRKSGIYPYILTGEERYLSIRAFTDKMKREAYERQNGLCKVCGEPFDIEDMEADHIKSWHEGGPTTAENCQMLCKRDHRTKSGK